MSAAQYQVTHMQFELLSLWRGIEEQDLARISDGEAKPDSTHNGEVVMVALPFSSLQLNPSLAAYLSLTSSPVEAIQQVMMREPHCLEPLMTALRTTREKLLAIGSEHVNQKRADSSGRYRSKSAGKADRRERSHAVQNLQDSQSRPAKKLSDLERTQSAVTSDSR
jgi:hypothetical protein